MPQCNMGKAVPLAILTGSIFMRLCASHVSLERSGRIIVSGLSFEVCGGELLTITGANGAGKSTLLRALAGLLPPSAGKISCGGLNDDRTLAMQTHYLGHLDALKTALTAQENLEFWADMGEGGMSPLRALGKVALAHVAEFPVGYLSAGQKRRVALARLLVAHRPVWLLDEPTTALDAQSQAMFADLVRAHLANGGLVVAAIHAPLGIEGARELRLNPVASARRAEKPAPPDFETNRSLP